MAVYQIRVNEKMALGKSIIAFLQSTPQAVTFETPQVKAAQKSELYEGLKSAFTDVRLMLDGKKKEKTLDELIDELRNNKY
jgi:hypothetical protein